ncbi:MAG: OmpA family protein [Lysobacterales bacterium]|jgi:OOP family OmpA-OmpF porin
MKKRKLVLTLAAIGLTLGSTGLWADGDQPWHVTGIVGGASLDNNRDTRNDDVLMGIGFGRFFGDNLSLDLEYDEFSGTYRGYDTVWPGATYDQWKLSNLGLQGRYYYGEGTLRPFLTLGIGYLKHRNIMDEGQDISLNGGVGVAGQLSKHLSARAQIIYRLNGDDESQPRFSNYGDVIYTVALSFDFGGKEPPPPPPPPAEPPPPPPPPPNPDLDGDGVPNERDKCPNTRQGAVVDLDGCEVEAVIELQGVHFDFDKATLRPEAKKILDEAAALLQEHERVIVEVAGHTDSTGPEDYNQGLSERRANSVRDYLISKGVTATRMTARGYGETRPVATNDTKEGRAENRRVELVVLDR